MEQSSGDGGANRPKLSSSSSADRLSALPDNILILILILLGLNTITEAAQTSVLSRRWRHIWMLLPELTFRLAPDDRHIREVLASSEAPVLRRIHVVTKDDSPESVTAWLPLVGRRLSGDLVYRNRYMLVTTTEEQEVDGGAIQLPCFGKATVVDLDLGYLPLALPSSGEFTRLTKLFLAHVHFHGTRELGDIFSSPRCPCLRHLRIEHAEGLAMLTVHSESLLQLELWFLYELQKLNIDAPVLKELTFMVCFAENQTPAANISAPQLISLLWRTDVCDPSYVQLGNFEQLQRLRTDNIAVCGDDQREENNDKVQRFLQHFQVIHTLEIGLEYPEDNVSNCRYLMEDITHLPHVTFLTMYVMNGGHSFGTASFHVLRLCTGIRRLSLALEPSKAKSTCLSGCICDQPTNWKIEELQLNCLKEVEITNLKGVGHEVAFLKQLFNWAVVLEKVKITIDYSVSKSKAKEFCRRLLRIFRPEIAMDLHVPQFGSDVGGTLARR